MSEAAKFPTRRLRDAGATDAEINELHAAFARSDEVYQKEFERTFLGKSKVEVRVWLEDARKDRFVSEEATNAKDEAPSEPAKRRGKAAEPTASVTTGNEDDESDE